MHATSYQTLGSAEFALSESKITHALSVNGRCLPVASRVGVGDQPMIMPSAAFDLRLEGETVEALRLQRPLPDGMLSIVARGEKEDPPVEAITV
jgi:hypothetical protein